MHGQEYFTALEVAELTTRLKVGSMPQTKDGIIRFIKREGWENSALCRDRVGRGGGREYHFSLFPEFLVNAMISADQKERAVIASRKAMAAQQTALVELGNTDLTARQRTVMEARSAIVQAVKHHEIEAGSTRGQAVAAVIEKCKSERGLNKLARTANDRAGSDRALSRAAIYRWIKEHAEKGVYALAPKATKDTHSFPWWFPQFMAYFAKPQAPTITDALDDLRYKGRINDVPSYDQVRRCLKKLDKVKGTQARHRGREGSLALKARHAYVVRDTTGLLPTSVYTADGKTFDAEVQHPVHGRPFRPEITSILDVHTRKCVGWSVGLAENANDVRDALRVACMWNGIPAIFYVDRGSGFKNDALDNEVTGFCARLGMTKMHSLPYNSQARGIIERYNGSALNPLAKDFSTYVGSDMDRQARQKSFKQTRKELREVGASALLPTWQEFIDALKAKIDRYNDSQHRGLEYRDRAGRKHQVTPNEMWQRAIESGFEPTPVLDVEADDLFRQYERRRTRRAMVSFLTNSYFHMDLEPYDGLDILVGYDFHDASKVWCREIEVIDGEEQPGRLIAVAKFEGNKERYVPLTAERNAIEKRQKSRLSRANAHIDEIEAEANAHQFLELNSSNTVSIDTGKSSQSVTIDAVALEPNDTPQTVQVTATPSRPNMRGDRPVFNDDASLSAWCCEHPDKMNERDRSLLVTLLRSKSDREYLRIEGIDLDALTKLVRSVA